ncbi:MAG: hypothetical protein RLZZ58_1987 [Pseudomonadota bacterium]
MDARSPDTPGFASLPAGYRAVVIGAGGGIGGALAAHIAADPRCAALYALSRSGVAVAGATTLACDLDDDASLAAAATIVAAGGPVDLLFIATGRLHRGEDVQPEKSWRAVRRAAMAEIFAANSVGPMLAVQAFLPHMPRRSRALVGLLGARVGSIGDNRMGGWYSYRAAKAALAMLVRTLAIELARTHPDAAVLLLHPGTVDTALSAPFRGGAAVRLSPADSAARLIAVLDGVSAAASGAHIDWQGKVIPA